MVWWWRLAGVWQGLLLGAAAVALAWIALILVFGRIPRGVWRLPTLLSNTGALPWIVALQSWRSGSARRRPRCA